MYSSAACSCERRAVSSDVLRAPFQRGYRPPGPSGPTREAPRGKSFLSRGATAPPDRPDPPEKRL
eukprot:11425307-Alexandrium_andersonii.AAC.1